MAVKALIDRFCAAAAMLNREGMSPQYRTRTPRAWVVFLQACKVFLGSRTYTLKGDLGSLTPIQLEGADYSRYRAELQRALRTPNVRNIAVTGAYGAGKSSLIQSFSADHNEYNFCFISLAAFNLPDNDAQIGNKPPPRDANDEPHEGDDSIERIEATIVQQFLYSVAHETIPQTRLKRIRHTSKLQAFLYSLFTIALVLALVRLFGLPKEVAALSLQFPFEQLLQASPVTCALVAVFGLTLVLYKVLSSALSLRLQSLSLKGVSLAQTSVTSVLHKQIDEIVYLFERSRIDVVLIEDLDRFADASPFMRLREINFIINTSPGIKRPVHFIYLIRDDLFTASDRVKFFDFVIPVVSVINTDNSKQKMLDHMESRGWSVDSRPSEGIVEAVCYYVDDMRQLVNILNEYDLFIKVADHAGQLKKDKVFAAVVTKCLFPREYSQLLKGDGPLFELIKSYEEWGLNKELELIREIEVRESDLASLSSGIARTEVELRTLMWAEATERWPDNVLQGITVPSGEKLGFRSFITHASIDDSLGNDEAFTLHFEHVRAVNVKSSDLLGDGPGSLRARMFAVREAERGAHQTLSGMRRKLVADRITALSQAITYSEFAAHVAKLSHDKKLGPAGYLVSRGHFGEDYFDYSGHFYEGSVSRSDKTLMLRIKSGELVGVGEKVDNPAQVLRRMSPADLRHGRGLVTQMVEYLFCNLDTSTSMDEHRNATVIDADQHLGRLDELVRSCLLSPSWPMLSKHLALSDISVLLRILTPENQCGESPWKEMIAATVISGGPKPLENVPEQLNEQLGALVAGLRDGSSFAKYVSDEEGAQAWLDHNGIYIARVDELSDQQAADCLLRMNALTLDLHNIRTVGSCYGLNWQHRAFTLKDVLGLPEGDLRFHLLLPTSRLTSVILEQDGELSDSGDAVVSVLNSAPAGSSNLAAYIERVSFQVGSIADVDGRYWKCLAANLRLRPTWTNVALLSGALSDEDFALCATAMASSESYMGLLEQDLEGLKELGRTAASDVLARLLELSGNGSLRVAKAIGLLSTHDLVNSLALDLSSEQLGALLVGVGGRWVSWVFESAQRVGATQAGDYLATALKENERVLPSGPINAGVVQAALLKDEGVGARLKILATCLPHVHDWTKEEADAVCGVALLAMVGSSAELLISAMGKGWDVLLKNASAAYSFEVLRILIERLAWADVRSIAIAASDGILAPLDQPGAIVSMPASDSAVGIAKALYWAGVIRKPVTGRRTVQLQSLAKVRTG